MSEPMSLASHVRIPERILSHLLQNELVTLYFDHPYLILFI